MRTRNANPKCKPEMRNQIEKERRTRWDSNPGQRVSSNALRSPLGCPLPYEPIQDTSMIASMLLTFPANHRDAAGKSLDRNGAAHVNIMLIS